MSEAAGQDDTLTVTVEVFDEYVSGLPMLVAITLENRTTDTGMTNTPRFNALSAKAPLIFEWDRKHESKARWSIQDEPRGPTLSPGESLRMLFDMSTLYDPPKQGTHELRVKLRHYDDLCISKPVKLKVVAPSHADSAALALLAPLPEHSWPEFVENNPRTITSPHVPERSARLLAWHLFMQRAGWGKQGPAEIDPKSVEALRHRPLEAEAELYRCELLHSRKDPAAQALAAQIAKRWPGLRRELAWIEKGDGPIAGLRERLSQ